MVLYLLPSAFCLVYYTTWLVLAFDLFYLKLTGADRVTLSSLRNS